MGAGRSEKGSLLCWSVRHRITAEGMLGEDSELELAFGETAFRKSAKLLSSCQKIPGEIVPDSGIQKQTDAFLFGLLS